MKHIAKTSIILFAFATILCRAGDTCAQQSRSGGSPVVVTSTRIAMPAGAFVGPLFVTIGGKERKIADAALEVWIIQGGTRVVYSGRDGAGGFEDEGQSLRIYDARTGHQRKILSEYVAVDRVTEVTTSTNKTALLVDMSDGGLGASYLAVVDPERGEVFFRSWARVLSRRGDIIVIGHYKEDDWAALNDNPKAKIKPYKKERQNLNAILKRRVIVNKRDRDF